MLQNSRAAISQHSFDTGYSCELIKIYHGYQDALQNKYKPLLVILPDRNREGGVLVVRWSGATGNLQGCSVTRQ